MNDWSAEHEAEYTNILTDVPVQFRFLVSSSLMNQRREALMLTRYSVFVISVRAAQKEIAQITSARHH